MSGCSVSRLEEQERAVGVEKEVTGMIFCGVLVREGNLGGASC